MRWILVSALLAAGPAVADPVALRTPDATGAVLAHVGTPELGVGVEIPGELRLGLGLRSDLGAVELAVGQTLPLGSPERWGFDGIGAIGLVVPTRRPTLALSVTAGMRGGYRGERFHWSLGGVVPATFGIVDGVAVRLPLLAETWLGLRLRSVWIGPRLATGAIVSPGTSPSLAAQAGLSVSWTP